MSESASGTGGHEGARRRIDVHHHIAPPEYLAEVGPTINPPLKSWSLAKAIEDMDEGHVATAIVSVTQIAVRIASAERARRVARACNEFAARMVADHKGRFGMFVALPLPDIEGSLREIEYGLDQLKADGVGLYTSYHDKWLGDPAFAPVFEELNRRGTVCYVHPATPDCCHNLVPGVGDAAIEYGTDTTRAIARMVFSGSAQRYRAVRMIWSHAGGTMPFLAERFIRMAQQKEYAGLLPDGFVPEAQRFFYDTAQASNRYALSSARALIPASNFVFGTDYPYRTAKEHVEGLAHCGVFDAAELRAIDRDNLASLLPQYRESAAR
ncbi:MAG TPA: amidohydrolase family protein [Stellaceae bacterium]|nr:amidohydrolase family protein [Stellaceae bacterium]